MKLNKKLSKKTKYGDLIFASKYWELFLAPSQTYLGTSVLSLKRDCIGLRDVEKGEWNEFNDLVKLIELTLIKAFNVTLFNWAFAANAIFQNKAINPTPQVHWHIHPRYKDPVIFNDLKFDDKEFGYPPRPKLSNLSEDMRIEIIKKIRESL